MNKFENLKNALINAYPEASDLIFTSKEIVDVSKTENLPIPSSVWRVGKETNNRIMGLVPRIKKYYNFNEINSFTKKEQINKPQQHKIDKSKSKSKSKIELLTNVKSTHHESKTFELSKLLENDKININDYIPKVSTKYIRSGLFSDISKIMKTSRFFPIMVSGPKGCGKTLMIEQAAARLKKPIIRVNITSESDESKLIGHMNLINGNTVWTDGPVLKAMKHGMVLILDEIDLGGDKILCLQSILEGGSYINKKTSEVIEPKSGFTIIMTSNTIGLGNVDGKYAHTQIMNSAFLDRIKMTFIFEKPGASVELKILNSLYLDITGEEPNEVDSIINSTLSTWSASINKANQQGIIDDIISTRKLTFILESYLIFGNIEKCIINSLNNFEEDIIEPMLSLWRTAYGINFNNEDENKKNNSEEINFSYDSSED